MCRHRLDACAAEHSAAEAEAWKLADELTTEICNASAIAIATPLFNWGPPSALKAYIDRIVNVRT